MPDWLAIVKAYIDDLEARLTAARAGYLDNINNPQIKSIGRPLPSLCEAWFALDTGLWIFTNPATGSAWIQGVDGVTGHHFIYSAPNALENCALRSNIMNVISPVNSGINNVVRKAIFEVELQLVSVANIDNTVTFLGLGALPWATRATNDIIGWCLTADALTSLTDSGGVETTNTGFGETLTNWNKLRIELSNGSAKFFLNEAQVANHIANLSPAVAYIRQYMATEAGGAATINLGMVRCWMEDVA